MEYPEKQLRFLLALYRISGLGPSKLSKTLESGADLSQLFDNSGYCKALQVKVDWSLVEQDLKWAAFPNCYIISRQNSAYPSLLKEIDNAPALLFVQGNLKLLAKPQIAIVGSRNPTPSGIEIATHFARHFSKTGFAVTSGLAIGIDGAAHKGALLEAGNTIAVLGSGLDRIYPVSHQRLAQQIVDQGGALVSEFPIGTPPLSVNFPRRNRVISGLSIGTLVVEATLKSGSLITARLALEQGREVFAIPGSIHSPLAKGCHSLIRQGAKLVETAEDVLEELQALLKYVIRSTEKSGQPKAVGEALNDEYEAFLAYVGYETTSMDRLIALSGLTANKVSIMLLELELRGYVASVPGGYARLLS